MSRDVLVAVSVVALVVLAGCGGAANGTATPDPGGSDATATPGGGGSGTGRFAVYLSDQQNAIDRFEHLNVTVTRVGLHRANASGTGTPAGTATNDTSTATAANDTSTATAANDTSTPASETSADGDADGGEWIEHDVENVTVDLTRLQGSKATRLAQFDVPNGTYTKVFVHVSDVNGTLKEGGSTAVKLPSDRLQLNTNVRVGAGERTAFVFDVSVVEAGNSGKFVLKPVVSESGADKEITDVDATPGQERLNLALAGGVAPGENVTVSATRNGSPVANATVYVDDEAVGETDADGEYAFAVPSDANRVRVRVVADGAEARLTRRIDRNRGRETSSPMPTTAA